MQFGIQALVVPKVPASPQSRKGTQIACLTRAEGAGTTWGGKGEGRQSTEGVPAMWREPGAGANGNQANPAAHSLPPAPPASVWLLPPLRPSRVLINLMSLIEGHALWLIPVVRRQRNSQWSCPYLLLGTESEYLWRALCSKLPGLPHFGEGREAQASGFCKGCNSVQGPDLRTSDVVLWIYKAVCRHLWSLALLIAWGEGACHGHQFRTPGSWGNMCSSPTYSRRETLPVPSFPIRAVNELEKIICEERPNNWSK